MSLDFSVIPTPKPFQLYPATLQLL